MKPNNAQPDFDDIHEEMEHERFGVALTEQELEDALKDMRAGKSPKHFSANPEFQAALKMHVMTSDSEIDSSFKEKLETQLQERFQQDAAEHESVQPWYVNLFTGKPWIPAASFGAVAVVVLAVIVFAQNSENPNTLAQNGNENDSEIARVVEGGDTDTANNTHSASNNSATTQTPSGSETAENSEDITTESGSTTQEGENDATTDTGGTTADATAENTDATSDGSTTTDAGSTPENTDDGTHTLDPVVASGGGNTFVEVAALSDTFETAMDSVTTAETEQEEFSDITTQLEEEINLTIASLSSL